VIGIVCPDQGNRSASSPWRIECLGEGVESLWKDVLEGEESQNAETKSGTEIKRGCKLTECLGPEFESVQLGLGDGAQEYKTDSIIVLHGPSAMCLRLRLDKSQRIPHSGPIKTSTVTLGALSDLPFSPLATVEAGEATPCHACPPITGHHGPKIADLASLRALLPSS
jgi:hypothetical protein